MSHMEKAKAAAIRWSRIYARNGYASLTFDECLGAAYEGLVLAVRRWDPARGASFYSYAFEWMRSCLANLGRRYRRANGWSYMPSQAQAAEGKTGMQRLVVVAPIPESNEGKVMELPAPPEDLDGEILRQQQHALVLKACVTEQQRRLFGLLLEGCTQTEAAARLGVSRQRVFQIIEQAIPRIRARVQASVSREGV